MRAINGFVVSTNLGSVTLTYPICLTIGSGNDRKFLSFNTEKNELQLIQQSKEDPTNYLSGRWELEIFTKNREDVFPTDTALGELNSVNTIVCYRLKHFQTNSYLAYDGGNANPNPFRLTQNLNESSFNWIIRFPKDFKSSEDETKDNTFTDIDNFLIDNDRYKTNNGGLSLNDIDYNYQLIPLTGSTYTNLNVIDSSSGTISIGKTSALSSDLDKTINFNIDLFFQYIYSFPSSRRSRPMDVNVLMMHGDSNLKLRIRHKASDMYLSMTNLESNDARECELVLMPNEKNGGPVPTLWTFHNRGWYDVKNIDFKNYPYYFTQLYSTFFTFFYPIGHPNIIMNHDPNGDSFPAASDKQQSAAWILSINDEATNFDKRMRDGANEPSVINGDVTVRFVQYFNNHNPDDWNDLNKQPVLAFRPDANGVNKLTAIPPRDMNFGADYDFELIYMI